MRRPLLLLMIVAAFPALSHAWAGQSYYLSLPEEPIVVTVDDVDIVLPVLPNAEVRLDENSTDGIDRNAMFVQNDPQTQSTVTYAFLEVAGRNEVDLDEFAQMVQQYITELDQFDFFQTMGMEQEIETVSVTPILVASDSFAYLVKGIIKQPGRTLAIHRVECFTFLKELLVGIQVTAVWNPDHGSADVETSFQTWFTSIRDANSGAQ